MITREHFNRIDNCQESLAYVARQPSLTAAWNNCERPDWLLAFARKAEIASKEQFVRVAIGEAEAVLPIWTTRYPDDDRPQKTIKTAKDCLGDQTSGTRAAANAAYAAASAAIRADASSAAVYAAYAAAAYAASAASASAARYAANAAYAAASAAYAATCATCATADGKDAFRRAQCDRIRAIIPNPFVDNEGDKQ